MFLSFNLYEMLFIKRMMIVFISCVPLFSFAQLSPDSVYILQPERVFDGEQMHEGWQVVIRNNRIEYAGVPNKQPGKSRLIILSGCTLLPGLIEGHSHLFLHPYNETPGTTRCLRSQEQSALHGQLFMQKRHCLRDLQRFGILERKVLATTMRS